MYSSKEKFHPFSTHFKLKEFKIDSYSKSHNIWETLESEPSPWIQPKDLSEDKKSSIQEHQSVSLLDLKL